MIAGLDSSLDAPSANDALTARAAGVGMWNGYIATKSGVNLEAPWTQLAFENARLCGATPLAFCSGLDDPVALKALAQAWNVRLCLDCESGIRGPGPWVSAWLAASGAGLYGSVATVQAYDAPFKVAAEYPGFDPGKTFPYPSGSLPTGWQWEGTHSEFGRSVDRGWYDDWFGLTQLAIGGGKAMSGFQYNGTDHVFDLGTAGDVLWSRTQGGAGGDVHRGYVSIGGNESAPVVEFIAWLSLDGTIIVRAKYADGHVREAWLQADGPWPQDVSWFGPDNAGPFGIMGLPGPKGDKGTPGPNTDEALRAYLRSGPQ